MSTQGYVYQLTREAIVIPQENWVQEGELWTCTIQHNDVSTDTDVDIALAEESIGVPLCDMVKPGNGQVKLYAYARPGEDISATIRVLEVRA